MQVETASGLLLGERALQQDAVQTFNDAQTGTCILCLSDGIGGAGNGHLASRLIVRTASEHMRTHLFALPDGGTLPGLLRDAAQAANIAIRTAVQAHPDKTGMGGTLLLAAIRQGTLHYLSIGDSLIYRIRKGRLTRVNQVHSLASSADHLVAAGRLAQSALRGAASSTLTSALTGQVLQKIDVPARGLACARKDVLLLASDGIETLSGDDIARTVAAAPQNGAAAATAALISRIEDLAAKGQDNVSAILAVI